MFKKIIPALISLALLAGVLGLQGIQPTQPVSAQSSPEMVYPKTVMLFPEQARLDYSLTLTRDKTQQFGVIVNDGIIGSTMEWDGFLLEQGEYQLYFPFMRGKNRGTFVVYFDGQLVYEQIGYYHKTMLNEGRVGVMAKYSGQHNLKFVITNQYEKATDMQAGWLFASLRKTGELK